MFKLDSWMFNGCKFGWMDGCMDVDRLMDVQSYWMFNGCLQNECLWMSNGCKFDVSCMFNVLEMILVSSFIDVQWT